MVSLSKERFEIDQIPAVQDALKFGRLAYALKQSPSCRAFFCEAFLWPESPTTLEKRVNQNHPVKTYKNNFVKYARRMNKVLGREFAHSEKCEEDGKYHAWQIDKSPPYNNPFEVVYAIFLSGYFEGENKPKNIKQLKQQLFGLLADLNKGFGFVEDFFFEGERCLEPNKVCMNETLAFVDAGLKDGKKLAGYKKEFEARIKKELAEQKKASQKSKFFAAFKHSA